MACRPFYSKSHKDSAISRQRRAASEINILELGRCASATVSATAYKSEMGGRPASAEAMHRETSILQIKQAQQQSEMLSRFGRTHLTDQ
eukprot:1120469-Pyramimonas_sp.AAC.1